MDGWDILRTKETRKREEVCELGEGLLDRVKPTLRDLIVAGLAIGGYEIVGGYVKRKAGNYVDGLMDNVARRVSELVNEYRHE